jgi:hypothetical protein
MLKRYQEKKTSNQPLQKPFSPKALPITFCDNPMFNVMLREVAASSVCELNFLAVDYKHKQIWILRLRAE